LRLWALQMDLRLKEQITVCTSIRKLGSFGAALLLYTLACAEIAAASGHDYLEAADVEGGWVLYESRTETISISAKTQQVATISYRAFDGGLHSVIEHAGHYVSVLLPADAYEGPVFTADHVQEMVDQLDTLYVLYRELLHIEPAGAGRLNVAFVPDTCGMGCGLLGHKGVEILLDPWNLESIIRELDAGRLDSLLVHELAHNFDGFAEYLHYLPDHAHAWTDMFEFFAHYRYARNSRNDEAPDDVYHSPISSVWMDYVADATADWETCVKNLGCEDDGLAANNLWAMLYYRVESLHGIDALVGSFEFLAEHARRFPPPRSEEEKEGLRILSLAAGAGTNIACYMDSLRWAMPENLRDELQRQFGGPPEACQDLDADGFNRIGGDCDDHDPQRHLFAEEIPGNGLDDDCDSLVDEQHLVEAQLGGAADNFEGEVQVRIPFEIDGTASGVRDTDAFRFPLGSSRRARVTLCADEHFRGWAVGLQPDGRFLEAGNWYSYQPAAGCTSSTFDFKDFGEGGLSVLPDESTGGYSLKVSEASPQVPELGFSVQVRPRAAGGVLLEVDDREGLLTEIGTQDVEFWISGVALQIVRPYTDGMMLELAPLSYPQLQHGKWYEVRMRPRAAGRPLAAFSAGQLFRYQRTAATPSVDHGFSGAWYDPGHEGEGFIVEVLEENRALVYWFTYSTDGKQRWMLGTGEIRDSRIIVADLLDASGGRFGDDFDPGEVILANRGSLSITFLSCSEAVANYLVDDTGGHQVLNRLTHVFGHPCGAQQDPAGSGLSGSWYDPTHDGEGFVVQQLDAEAAVVYWFTYDAEGNQAWMVNTGLVDGDRMHFPGLVRPLGGLFGRSFDPLSVRREPWGDLLLELDCDGGAASYTPASEGFSEGSQALVPLTRLQHSGCSPR
jgi:hypothetical protein